MMRIEKENAELRRSLNDAIVAWTTEKQLSGISCVLSVNVTFSLNMVSEMYITCWFIHFIIKIVIHPEVGLLVPKVLSHLITNISHNIPQ